MTRLGHPPDKVERVCQRIEAGENQNRVALEEGVDPSTIRKWMKDRIHPDITIPAKPPPSKLRKFRNEIVLAIPDMHHPFVHKDALDFLLAVNAFQRNGANPTMSFEAAIKFARDNPGKCVRRSDFADSALAAKQHYELTGEVVKIADGDTLTILDGSKTQHKIRLAGIDAPEKGQAFGTKAKENLAGKVFRRNVRVEVIDVDRYHREAGRIFLGDRFINEEMCRDGYAWDYLQYDKPREFAAAEADARDHHRGLWVDRDPTPPWEWRRAKRLASKAR